MSKTAGERESGKLVSCSTLNSADVDENNPRYLPDGDDGVYKLPALWSLVVQRYRGDTCDGKFHGEGVVWFQEGHTYKGMFSKGLMDGPGVFTQAAGLKYEGEFVCNMIIGRGTYTWPDGSSYQGEVYNGIRHGTGTYKCAKTGVFYRGQWYQGKRHGKGTVYYNEDKTSWYKGDWVKNNKEGWGERCYPSGNVYSGEWRNNLRHGEGRMRWLELGQQYVGQWLDGVQHGRGTHVWLLRRVDGSQYSQNNQYEGDFVQGQRHGQGTFHYAGGAIYEGQWKNDGKHGQGKFTFMDGRVFEGEFVDNQMKTASVDGNRALWPLDSDSSVLGPDMALNIECVLDKIPERNHDTERKQVEFVVLRQDVELRSIYSFYSRLGHAHTPDNTFLLSRLQLWRLFKDCNIHRHGISLIQIDHLIKEDSKSAEIHCPFSSMLFCRFLSCLVIVAYHIYSKDMATQKNIVAACLSKLITDNILPNAKNVKGFLFRQPDVAVVAMSYMKRSWEVYQALRRVNPPPRSDRAVTYRHLLWAFKDLCMLDRKLTTLRLLEIITAESCDSNTPSSCLNMEITFLEFFEVLLGSAVVKCQQVERGRLLSRSDMEAGSEPAEVEDSEKTVLTTSSSFQSAGSSTLQDVLNQQDINTKVGETSQSAELTEERRGEGKSVQTSEMEAKDNELQLRTQILQKFFNHFFFPAFDHHQSVTTNMREKKLRSEA
ncbi:radial spoke head 10 homolog B isoform X1 [Embiotoca jacksoni]|uniref:radial spoke head 10 homolog B isoform X1 n=1 Tax=Embiotoca jacksoni TaxID=100190 RepID=UPI0037041D22